MGYKTTSSNEPHMLDAPNAGVDGETTPIEGEVEPVGYVAPEDGYQFNPVLSDPEAHEMPTDDLHRMELPRHNRSAEENNGLTAERVIPYTPTGANPSYPQDAEPGFEEGPAEVPEDVPVEEPVVAPVDAPVEEPTPIGDAAEAATK